MSEPIPEDIRATAEYVAHLVGAVQDSAEEVIGRYLLAERRARDERAELDAKRYRWLRDDNAYIPEEMMCRGGEYLDELCDEGIAKAIRKDDAP